MVQISKFLPLKKPIVWILDPLMLLALTLQVVKISMMLYTVSACLMETCKLGFILLMSATM